MSSKQKVVFFDRDDTLIEDKIYLNDPDQVFYLKHAFDALIKLKKEGFQFIIVTNQSGIPRGLVEDKNLELIHKKMKTDYKNHAIEFLDFYHAPYLTTSDHYYRKPKPGMLLEGINTYNIDIHSSWMVGDRVSDVEAGHRAGLRSILLGNKEDPNDYPYAPPEAIAKSLMDVAEIIIKN